MSKNITIIPYGSLRHTAGSTPGDKLVHTVDQPQPLSQLLETIGVAGNNVQLVMVNHRAAGLDTQVGAGDRVALFPKEYPIFADWLAYRPQGQKRH